MHKHKVVWIVYDAQNSCFKIWGSETEKETEYCHIIQNTRQNTAHWWPDVCARVSHLGGGGGRKRMQRKGSASNLTTPPRNLGGATGPVLHPSQFPRQQDLHTPLCLFTETARSQTNPEKSWLEAPKDSGQVVGFIATPPLSHMGTLVRTSEPQFAICQLRMIISDSGCWDDFEEDLGNNP